MNARLPDAILGCLVGCAVGDALGLPFEGVNVRRLDKMRLLPLRYRLLFGHGMLSDDTEHLCMTARAVCASGRDDVAFGRAIAWELRKWFLAMPPATGLATLRACLKLLVGFPYTASGIHSAGNGPAMRSPILGVCFSNNEAQLVGYVEVSTRVTHTDAKAFCGSLVIALAAARASDGARVEPQVFLQEIEHLQNALHKHHAAFEELHSLLKLVCASVEAGETTRQFAAARGWGKGVTGYIYQTVPAVIHAWLSHQFDFCATVSSLIECGGDTDSTAAIAGALCGTQIGIDGIPAELVHGIKDWPRSIGWIHRLAEATTACAGGAGAVKAPSLFYPVVLSRNLFFLVVVLIHGLRRLLPPY